MLILGQTCAVCRSFRGFFHSILVCGVVTLKSPPRSHFHCLLESFVSTGPQPQCAPRAEIKCCRTWASGPSLFFFINCQYTVIIIAREGVSIKENRFGQSQDRLNLELIIGAILNSISRL